MKYNKFEGHTPGPWGKIDGFTTVKKSNGERIIHKTGAEGQCVKSQQRNFERRSKDSLLVAAAPDLLEACKRKDKLLEEILFNSTMSAEIEMRVRKELSREDV